jgi:hypothetical protein
MFIAIPSVAVLLAALGLKLLLVLMMAAVFADDEFSISEMNQTCIQCYSSFLKRCPFENSTFF